MLRWRIATILSAAIAISYLDRHALSVAVAAIQRDIPLSNTEFSQLQAALLLDAGDARHDPANRSVFPAALSHRWPAWSALAGRWAAWYSSW
jgi:hypothetical protein